MEDKLFYTSNMAHFRSDIGIGQSVILCQHNSFEHLMNETAYSITAMFKTANKSDVGRPMTLARREHFAPRTCHTGLSHQCVSEAPRGACSRKIIAFRNHSGRLSEFDQLFSMAENSESLPERPKEGGEDGEKGPSKGALKKMAKEKEKAEKAAKRAAEEAARKKEQEANDVSAADYGELPLIQTGDHESRISLTEMAQKYENTEPAEGSESQVVFRAVVENARNQSAKLSFLVFKQGFESIQAVVAASDRLSRQMVK